MSKLLQSVAIKEGMINEFDVLTVWNENQTDKPLNFLNHSWLKRNIKKEQKYLLEVTNRIKNELGTKYCLLVFDLLAKYDELYKELFQNDKSDIDFGIKQFLFEEFEQVNCSFK